MILSSISSLVLPSKVEEEAKSNDDRDDTFRSQLSSRTARSKRRQTTPYSASSPTLTEPSQPMHSRVEHRNSLSATPQPPSIKASPVPSQTLDELEMDTLSLVANFNKPQLDDVALRKKKASRTMSMSDHDFRTLSSQSSIFGSMSSTNESSTSASSGTQSPQILSSLPKVVFDTPLTRKTLAPLVRFPASSTPPSTVLAPLKSSRRTLSISLASLSLGTVQEQ